MAWAKSLPAIAVGGTFFVCAGAAMLLRYQPLAYQPDAADIRLWDRLTGRECLSPRPETTNVTGIACSKSEVAALETRINAAALAEQQQAARAASDVAYQK